MVRPSRSRFLRRDRERTGPRQLRQPKWRSTTAGPPCIIFGDIEAYVASHISFAINSGIISLNSSFVRLDFLGSQIQFAQFDFLVGLICTGISRDRFDAFQSTHFSRDFLADILCAFQLSTGDIVAMKVRQFHRDRDEQAWYVCVLRFYRDISTADIVAFKGRQFRDGTYGYAVLYNNGAYFGKVARWALASFDQVQVLDLTETDPTLKGFYGGFSDGIYGYAMPFNNGAYFGKMARWALASFDQVQVLDLTMTDPALKGFYSGFSDGTYGYAVPYNNGTYFGKVARWALASFSGRVYCIFAVTGLSIFDVSVLSQLIL